MGTSRPPLAVLSAEEGVAGRVTGQQEAATARQNKDPYGGRGAQIWRRPRELRSRVPRHPSVGAHDIVGRCIHAAVIIAHTPLSSRLCSAHCSRECDTPTFASLHISTACDHPRAACRLRPDSVCRRLSLLVPYRSTWTSP